MEGNKTTISVRMNGNEYMDYVESRKIKFPKLKKNQSIGLLIIAVSLLGLLLIPAIHEYFNPPEPVEWGSSNLFGVTIHNGLIMWLAISIGVAWMAHGFGFIIIRR